MISQETAVDRHSAQSDLVSTYEALAPNYTRLHRRWLRFAGGEAQAALEASVRTIARPGLDLLDAGCGDGAFARRLLAENLTSVNLTLLDPSEAMISLCSDIPARKVLGRLDALPFADESFDVIACAWVLETVPNPATALRDILRVLRPQGSLCLAFCADVADLGWTHWTVKQALTYRGTGRFLRVDAVTAMLDAEGFDRVRRLPCLGPASALLARKPG